MSADTVIHYRAFVGDQWCVLDKQFHAKGVLIPTLVPMEKAALFDSKPTALTAIRRTEETAEKIRISSIADWPKFKPLLFKGRIELYAFHAGE
jgi:hypothetical protein